MTDELMERFRRGLRRGRDPINSGADGDAITTADSVWLADYCEECGHTFRQGDRVFVQYGPPLTVLHHSPALPCSRKIAGASEAADDDRVQAFHRPWTMPTRRRLACIQSGCCLVIPCSSRSNRACTARSAASPSGRTSWPCSARAARRTRSADWACTGIRPRQRLSRRVDREWAACPLPNQSPEGSTRGGVRMSAEARYARHALIPDWDQRMLSAAFVVIVGVGAVGSEAARLLAQAGVGRLLLCDPDTVAESNLSRGALPGPAVLGGPKAEVVAEALLARESGLEVTVRVADFRHGVGLAELRSADLVLSCLDSTPDRIALSARCGMVAAGLLDAGTYPWGGEVRYFSPGGPCFACGCTSAERAFTEWHVACADPPGHAGASAPISAVTGAWQAVTAVRLLFGLPDSPRGGTAGPGYRSEHDRNPQA